MDIKLIASIAISINLVTNCIAYKIIQPVTQSTKIFQKLFMKKY